MRGVAIDTTRGGIIAIKKGIHGIAPKGIMMIRQSVRFMAWKRQPVTHPTNTRAHCVGQLDEFETI